MSKADAVIAVVIVGLVIFVVFLLVLIAANRAAHYDVVVKGGVPYCPKCNRQVSYRREYCRCCGYKFVSYEAAPEDATRVSEEKAKKAWEQRQQDAWADKQARLADEERRVLNHERTRAREERKALRDTYYLDRGITPGPFAWFWLLPDWLRAIIVGIGLSIAVVIPMFFIWSGLSGRGH